MSAQVTGNFDDLPRRRPGARTDSVRAPPEASSDDHSPTARGTT